MSRTSQRLLGALFLFVLPVAARAATGASFSASDADRLLAVPYLAQPARLCGGAAVAMVLRYWGVRDVFAEDFERLVDREANGIRASALASAVSERGWIARPVGSSNGDDAMSSVRTEINKGRPIIAQIEDSPGQFHYVVIVAVTDRDVVVHDPARAPFRVVSRADFDRSWAKADRWMLLILPPADRPAAPPTVLRAAKTADPATEVAAAPCDGLVSQGVTLALNHERDAAEHLLVTATELCPDDAAPWRELAGLRFTQSQYRESARLAERTLAIDPDDGDTWQLLASSRFLQRDLTGALEAWNHVGEPRADVVSIDGLVRTRQEVVLRLVGIKPRSLLTPEALDRATLRLRELPSARDAVVRYEPAPDGTAAVKVSVAERDVLPKSMMVYGVMGARALFSSELRGELTNLTGSGESWRGAWRWTPRRPRVAFQLAIPSPGWLPGIITLDAFGEHQTYRARSDVVPFIESRRHAGLGVSHWATSWLRWRAGAALDRFDKTDFLGVDGNLDLRFGPRATIAMNAGAWARNGGVQFGSGSIVGTWRSSGNYMRPMVTAFTGVDVTSANAPLALWEGAGARSGRDVLLRGHYLFTHSVLDGEVFGRRVAFATVEYEHPVRMTSVGQVNIAVFVDSAQAWQRLHLSTPSTLQVDAGIGLRYHPKGSAIGIRVDAGHGLRDSSMAFSFGWILSY